MNLFSFIAEEVREILARLGFRSLNEVIGRTDLLTQVSRGAADLDDLDLNPLLAQADAGEQARYCTLEGRNEVPDTLDAQMIGDARALFEEGEKMQLAVQHPQHPAGHRHAAQLQDHQALRHGRAQARPYHRAAARLRRPVAGRLRRAGPEARGLRRCQ